MYFDNDTQTFDGKQKAVCHYNGQWCALGYDKQLEKLLAGKPLPKLHQYDEGVPHYYSDILPTTQHYSDNEPETSAKWQQPEPTGVTRELDLVALVTLVQILVFFLILVTLVLDSSSSLLLFSRLSIPVLKLATMCYFCKSSS